MQQSTDVTSAPNSRTARQLQQAQISPTRLRRPTNELAARARFKLTRRRGEASPSVLGGQEEAAPLALAARKQPSPAVNR